MDHFLSLVSSTGQNLRSKVAHQFFKAREPSKYCINDFFTGGVEIIINIVYDFSTWPIQFIDEWVDQTEETSIGWESREGIPLIIHESLYDLFVLQVVGEV